MEQKKVLVLGAGIMASHMVPYLAEQGYKVDVYTLLDTVSDNPNIQYFKLDAKDPATRKEYLAKHYDCIVDYLQYSSAEAPFVLPELMANTDQYIYTSSGRIYDNLECPVKETSPRLLDTSKDPYLLNSDDYCIKKARGENIVMLNERKNWTIIRPSTIFGYMRYQLVTLEASNTVGRAFAGKKVVLPIQAKDKPASLSWAGDAGLMIGKLVFNDKAMGEIFNINSAEYNTWGQIADYYKDICNLQAVWVDKEDYLGILETNPFNRAKRWQLEYARLFDRAVDNSKVLAATGMSQSSMRLLYDGLKFEIGRTPRDTKFANSQRMDDYIAAHNL